MKYYGMRWKYCYAVSQQQKAEQKNQRFLMGDCVQFGLQRTTGTILVLGE